MGRDNFKRSTIDILAKRVAHRCSNPDCRVPTIGPQLKNDAAVSVGVAAHICAASVGGPRYDPKMTRLERIALSNGLWLCSNCSAKIDKNSSMYSVELLREWKKKAEAEAHREIGKKLPHPDDAKEMLGVVFGANPKRFIPDAISTIHNASSLALEQLDSRFRISSSYFNGTTTFNIQARENATIQVTVSGDKENNYANLFQRALETGEDVEIPSTALIFSGSPLFEQMNAEGGKFRISSPKKEAVIKMWVTTSDGMTMAFIDELKGNLHVGTKEFSFAGQACAGVLKAKFTRALADTCPASPFTLSLDYSYWEGKPINALPYFEPLFNFFQALFKGGELNNSVEVSGIQILAGKKIDLKAEDFLVQTYFFLRYTKAARAIAKFLNLEVNFKTSITYSALELEEILKVERIINNEERYNAEQITSKITCELVYDEPYVYSLVKGGVTGCTFESQEDSQSLEIFQTLVNLPGRRCVLDPVSLKLEKKLRGNKVRVELVPAEGFSMKTYFNPQE